jgi:hypothetical protein
MTLIPGGAETAVNPGHLLDPNGVKVLTHVKFCANDFGLNPKLL